MKITNDEFQLSMIEQWLYDNTVGRTMDEIEFRGLKELAIMRGVLEVYWIMRESDCVSSERVKQICENLLKDFLDKGYVLFGSGSLTLVTNTGQNYNSNQ